MGEDSGPEGGTRLHCTLEKGQVSNSRVRNFGLVLGEGKQRHVNLRHLKTINRRLKEEFVLLCFLLLFKTGQKLLVTSLTLV